MSAGLSLILAEWQFWMLELQFALVIITTIIEAPRVLPGRRAAFGAVALALLAWGLASTLPPPHQPDFLRRANLSGHRPEPGGDRQSGTLQ